MKKISGAVALLFSMALIGLFSFAPDILSVIFLALMAGGIGLGFFLGVMPEVQFAAGFRAARGLLKKIGDVHPAAAWVSVRQLDVLFGQKALDGIF